MNGKDFENLLKDSAETPRSLSPSKGSWERINTQLPTKTPFWQPWLKFLPFAIGIVSLLVWNMQLQYQMNNLKEELNITKKEVITLEQNVKEENTIVNHVSRTSGFSTTEQETNQNSNTDFIEKTNSSNQTRKTSRNYLKASNTSTINSYSTPSIGYQKVDKKNFNGNIKRNSSNSVQSSADDYQNPNINKVRKGTSSNSMDGQNGLELSKPLQNDNFDEKKDSLVFASKEDIQLEPIIQSNTDNFLDLEQRLLESIRLSNIEYLPVFSMPEIKLDTTNQEFDKPSKLDSLKTRVKSHLADTKLKLGPNVSGHIGLNGLVNHSYGMTAQAAIKPGFLVVMNVEKGKSMQGVAIDPFFVPLVISTPFPEPAPDLIPQDGVMMGLGVQLEYTQVALGLKKMWYPSEHIRPFVELGWMPYKEKKGEVDYIYGILDPMNPFLFDIEDVIVDINKDNYDLGWELNAGYGAAGLSASLFKNKVELNASLRYINMFSPSKTLYFSNDKNILGGQLGLAYNF